MSKTEDQRWRTSGISRKRLSQNCGRLACDQYFALHCEKNSQAAWLEMGESRYTLYQNLGGEFDPGLLLNKNGPHFVGAH